MTDITGQTIGPYQVGEKVAEGGMAAIYGGKDTRYDRWVAIKVLLSDLQEGEFYERFRREARSAAALQHPHVLSVYDSGVLEDSGLPYIVMAWAGGGSVANLMTASGGPLPLPQVGEILRQTASALDAAHSKGVVHRDIKPSNIMLSEDGQVMLGDFGIAKTVRDTALTAVGSQLGTPTYMPPEQIRDQEIGPWSDIYALGVVLYQMVTGQPPFQGNVSNILLQHVNENPPSVRASNPNLPKKIDRVIAKAMAKVPADRYRTAGEMAADFQAAIGASTGGTGPVAVPVGGGVPMWGIILAVVLLLAVLGGSGWAWFNGQGEATEVAQNGNSAGVVLETDTPTPSPTPTEIPPTPTPPAPGEPPGLVEPSVAQVYPPGSEITLRWSSTTPRLNERFKVLVRNIEQGVTRTDETTNLLYTLSGLEPGDYSWLIILEREDNGEWQEMVRSETRQFSIEAADSESRAAEDVAEEVVAEADTPTATLAPTDTPAPTATNTPAPPTATPRPAGPTNTPLPPTETPTPPPTATPVPVLDGKLAFSIPQGTSYKIYVVEVQQETPDSLYASIGTARQPSLSYDGSLLLANSTGGGSDAITMYRSSGEQLREVTCSGITAESGRPAWSPNGTFLVFDGLGADPANPQMYLHRVDTPNCDLGAARVLVNGGAAIQSGGLYPIWGSDSRIYFKGCATWAARAGDCGIWSIEQGGGGLIKEVDGANVFPTDVKAGRLIYMSADTGNWEIYSVRTGGSGSPTNLSNNSSSTDVWGTLSPDGRNLAFLSNRNGSWAIWLASANGSNARQWLPINPDWGEVDPNRLAQERMSWSP